MSDIPPDALWNEEVRLTLSIGVTHGEELLARLEEANLNLAQTIAALGFAIAWLLHMSEDRVGRERCLKVLTDTCNTYRSFFKSGEWAAFQSGNLPQGPLQ